MATIRTTGYGSDRIRIVSSCAECIHAGVCQYKNDKCVVNARDLVKDFGRGYCGGDRVSDMLFDAHMVCEIKCPDYKRSEHI